MCCGYWLDRINFLLSIYANDFQALFFCGDDEQFACIKMTIYCFDTPACTRLRLIDLLISTFFSNSRRSHILFIRCRTSCFPTHNNVFFFCLLLYSIAESSLDLYCVPDEPKFISPHYFARIYTRTRILHGNENLSRASQFKSRTFLYNQLSYTYQNLRISQVKHNVVYTQNCSKNQSLFLLIKELKLIVHRLVLRK